MKRVAHAFELRFNRLSNGNLGIPTFFATTYFLNDHRYTVYQLEKKNFYKLNSTVFYMSLFSLTNSNFSIAK
jgi:hypothetical protein